MSLPVKLKKKKAFMEEIIPIVYKYFQKNINRKKIWVL